MEYLGVALPFNEGWGENCKITIIKTSRDVKLNMFGILV